MIERVAIVGAGAMGCLFAARLAETGMQVTLVEVDPARVTALARDGVTLTDDGGTRTVPLAATLAADFAGPVDLVLLFTKGMHSRAAAQSVAHLARGGALALTLQNGIGNAEILAEVFPPDRVLMGTASVPADLDGPTEVSSHGRGEIALGGLNSAADAHAPEVAALLTRAGWEAQAVADVRKAVWEKVAFNAALNPLGAVFKAENGVLDNDAGRRIALAAVAETCAVARAGGIAVDQAYVERWVDYALGHHRTHKASMTQDREAGRQTEIETINGAIEREGRRLGVATPVIATLADLIRVAEAMDKQCGVDQSSAEKV